MELNKVPNISKQADHIWGHSQTISNSQAYLDTMSIDKLISNLQRQI